MDQELTFPSFNPNDKYDKIHEHIQKGKPLGKKDTKTLNIARQIYPLLCSGRTQREIVKTLVAAKICGETMAYSYMRATKIIFAEAGKANKEGERQILVEMATKTYRVAFEKNDAKTMDSAVRTLAKLKGLDDSEQNLTVIYQQLVMPKLEITDNPTVIDITDEEVKFEE